MTQLIQILQIITPIFVAVLLGILAKKKQLLTQSQMGGLQDFIVQFCLPCVLFNSCFNATLSKESLTSMALVIPLLLIASIWAFKFGKKKYPYHNLPMMFSAQETGMLGIPLFISLFGATSAFYIGVLDLAQAFIAIPVIAILTSSGDQKLSIIKIIQKVFKSPLLLMALLGLLLNVTGIKDSLDTIGLKSIIDASISFMAEPVSATMLFSVGYNFSIEKNNRHTIFEIATIHFVLFAIFGLIMQAVLLLLPSTPTLTRLAILLYSLLPASYLSASMGKNEDEYKVASGVCSILTIFTLLLFCILTIFVL